MTGRHADLPWASAAREATASPYIGRHRSQPDPHPDRCPSCGHPDDTECGCLCCYDDHSERPADV